MKQVLTLFAFIYLTMLAFPNEQKRKNEAITLRCENFSKGECLTKWKLISGVKNEQLSK